jgi:hypothetical protein
VGVCVDAAPGRSAVLALGEGALDEDALPVGVTVPEAVGPGRAASRRQLTTAASVPSHVPTRRTSMFTRRSPSWHRFHRAAKILAADPGTRDGGGVIEPFRLPG